MTDSNLERFAALNYQVKVWSLDNIKNKHSRIQIGTQLELKGIIPKKPRTQFKITE